MDWGHGDTVMGGGEEKFRQGTSASLRVLNHHHHDFVVRVYCQVKLNHIITALDTFQAG